MQTDIRWQQRFSNFKKAYAKLDEAVQLLNNHSENINQKDIKLIEIYREGLIQRFEYTHELAWNVMKDFLAESGNAEIFGSKDASRAAFKAGLITDGDMWMEMIKCRNLTSHSYDEQTVDQIFLKIINEFHPILEKFLISMNKKLK
jgi:nucleotidyltransferase substrate binding protein (TIGR01987 family)